MLSGKVHFSTQPLDASVPKDFIEDFQKNKKVDCNQIQMKQLVGIGEDLFQEGIDVMAFPNLFPGGKKLYERHDPSILYWEF